MKKIPIIIAALGAIMIISCGKNKKKPSDVYMPDMAYSRAVETYSSLDTLVAQGINYNAIPVKGTIKRGELFPLV